MASRVILLPFSERNNALESCSPSMKRGYTCSKYHLIKTSASFNKGTQRGLAPVPRLPSPYLTRSFPIPEVPRSNRTSFTFIIVNSKMRNPTIPNNLKKRNLLLQYYTFDSFSCLPLESRKINEAHLFWEGQLGHHYHLSCGKIY